MRYFCAVVWIVLLGILALPVTAQVRPVYDMGAVGLGQKLKRIANTKRVMHIGAHPDDEDSGMLAYLARRENARTVYLSLTRGDGGQNVIGPELFEALGIIRSEELLQARTLDGAEQMFTRAFDYGYSKTLAEAQKFWDEDLIKCDVVRAIRLFRPQVVIPRFSGTPNDGHGQHQFAGYISPIAVKAAADPNQCKDVGPPWKVTKFYVGRGFRDRNEPTLSMNTGEYDHLLGRSYFEIALQGRSQHKSQEQGFIEIKGERTSGVNLTESDLVVRGAEDSVFDGLDTSFASLVGDRLGVAASLRSIQSDFENDVSKLTLSNPVLATDALIRLRSRLRGLVETQKELSDRDRSNIKEKINEIDNAVLHASGLQIDALSGSETVADEESVGVKVNVFAPEGSGIEIKDIYLDTPEGWYIDDPKPVEPDNSFFARFFREKPTVSKAFDVTVPMFANPTQPYFLEETRKGYEYYWQNDGNRNRPFQPELMTAIVEAVIEGEEFTFHRPVEYRFADPTRGELRRNLNVVPKLSVDLDQQLIIVKRGGGEIRRHVSVNVRNYSSKPINGKVALVTPKGFSASSKENAFSFKKEGESASFDFEIKLSGDTKPGDYQLRAVAEIDGRRYTQSMNTVAYEHIQTHRYYTPAQTRVVVADLATAPVKIGYVMGSGDSGPDALRQMGFEVELLDDKRLASIDFSRFDTVVIGIRASETNPAFIANNARLLEYVKNGGTMIVQYQKFPFQRLNLAPYPIRFNARVSEEDAKVTILKPGHPVFNFPNKITQKDFEGWVQERNLYAFRSFDEKYTPLLESHDTGEEPNNGGMVIADYGEGKYMYVSYAFFRQLPAGVPGAYRLFSNIVSLGEKKRIRSE
ncbi:MAG: PIG-L family deacetylase [Pyrinomonadaceae bacterium]|nr:PIG-L family deacetylase [Pyrinomonadaceae bacterium]